MRVVLGNQGIYYMRCFISVGKCYHAHFFSSLLLRFTDDTFDNEQAATIGVDFKVKLINIDGNNVKLAIWVAIP